MIERHDNPYTYITALKVPVIQIINKPVKNPKTGEYESEDYFIEADDYCRVYITPARRKHIFSLSARSRDLYLYIVYTMNKDYEHVILSYNKFNEFHKECGADRDASPRGFRDSIKELVSRNIIDLKDMKAETYWISPHYFFPGDRSKKYPENMMVVRKVYKESAYERSLRDI